MKNYVPVVEEFKPLKVDKSKSKYTWSIHGQYMVNQMKIQYAIISRI